MFRHKAILLWLLLVSTPLRAIDISVIDQKCVLDRVDTCMAAFVRGQRGSFPNVGQEYRNHGGVVGAEGASVHERLLACRDYLVPIVHPECIVVVKVPSPDEMKAVLAGHHQMAEKFNRDMEKIKLEVSELLAQFDRRP